MDQPSIGPAPDELWARYEKQVIAAEAAWRTYEKASVITDVCFRQYQSAAQVRTEAYLAWCKANRACDALAEATWAAYDQQAV